MTRTRSKLIRLYVKVRERLVVARDEAEAARDFSAYYDLDKVVVAINEVLGDDDPALCD
jgi:hypothetical protein